MVDEQDHEVGEMPLHHNRPVLYSPQDKNKRRRLNRSNDGNSSGNIFDLLDNSYHSDEDDPLYSEHELSNDLHVGGAFQAVIPPPSDQDATALPEKATLLWVPREDIAETALQEYIDIAREKYQYSIEQALGILYFHNYDIQKALHDLPSYVPNPDRWSAEDKVLFEQAFSFHGKRFDRIRQMLPDKSVGSLVKFYYLWKKGRNRVSYIDRQAMKMEEDAENGVSLDSDDSDNEAPMREFKKSTYCANCGSKGAEAHLQQVAARGSVCRACLTSWKTTGYMPEVERDLDKDTGDFAGSSRGKRCPKGIHLSMESLQVLTAPDNAGSKVMNQMAEKIAALKHQVQINKQMIGGLKFRAKSTNIDQYRMDEDDEPRGRAFGRWTTQEILLGIQGFRRYGLDFLTIAEIIGTKTESHVRTFYMNYKDRYRLDNIIEERETEIKQEASNDVVDVD